MFVRTKRFKNNEYAYLVENKWTKKGTRQRAVKYLGKVITPELNNGINEEMTIFFDVEKVKKTKNYQEALKKVLNYAVECFKFKKNENVSINITKHKVLCDGKNCALKLKDGFFCEYTLKRLFNLHYVGQEKLEFGYKLAESFLICGISLDKELFVEICNKAFYEYKTKISPKKLNK
jgi:hypothetical protein